MLSRISRSETARRGCASSGRRIFDSSVTPPRMVSSPRGAPLAQTGGAPMCNERGTRQTTGASQSSIAVMPPSVQAISIFWYVKDTSSTS